MALCFVLLSLYIIYAMSSTWFYLSCWIGGPTTRVATGKKPLRGSAQLTIGSGHRDSSVLCSAVFLQFYMHCMSDFFIKTIENKNHGYVKI